MLFNVAQDELIKKTAEELKKVIHMPSWAPFVKTGNHKQRPPVNDDWWYVRAASVLRKVYLLGPVGVSKLRIKYGGKKNRGVRPEKFVKGSGNIIRKILQQLEEAKLIKQVTIKKRKGRVIAPFGASMLFSVAKSLGGSVPKKAPKPKVAKEEKKPAPEAKEEAKPEVKEAPKEEAKPEAKKEAKVDAKEEKAPKVEAKPEAKEEKKPEAKEEAKPKEEVKEDKPAKEEKVSEDKPSDDAQKSEKQGFSGAQDKNNLEQPKEANNIKTVDAPKDELLNVSDTPKEDKKEAKK